MGQLAALAAQAKLVQARQREPLAALDTALATDSERYGLSLRGWAFATSDLDAIQLPPELLASGPLRIAIEVNLRAVDVVISRAEHRIALWYGPERFELPVDLAWDPGIADLAFGVIASGQVSSVTFRMDDLRIATVP